KGDPVAIRRKERRIWRFCCSLNRPCFCFRNRAKIELLVRDVHDIRAVRRNRDEILPAAREMLIFGEYKRKPSDLGSLGWPQGPDGQRTDEACEDRSHRNWDCSLPKRRANFADGPP